MYKKTIFSIVWALLCLSFTSYSQKGAADIMQLGQGERVPDSLLNKPLEIMNNSNGSKIASLKSYNGKLIILDFWATWCGACVSTFSKLDSLQKMFPESISILLVNSANTGDTPEKISSILERGGYKLPSVVRDTLLTKLFRHELIPHYVWLRNDSVLATTSSSEVSADHIKRVLNFQVFKPDIKKDLMDFDLSKPLFWGDNGDPGNQILYRSQLSGAISGIASQTQVTKDKSGLIRRYCCLNISRTDLFRLAFNAMSVPRNRIYVTADSINMAQRKLADPRDFCFELICPPSDIDVVKARMRRQLEEYFGYSAILEYKKVPCLVLKDIGFRNRVLELPVGYLFNSNNKALPNYIRGQPLSLLISYLNQKLPLPILDESGCSVTVNLDLPQDLTNLSALKVSLEKQGLSLTEQFRILTVLVFKPLNKL